MLVLHEDYVSQVATEYIATIFGPTFGLDSPCGNDATWWARIRYYRESDEPAMVGRIQLG